MKDWKRPADLEEIEDEDLKLEEIRDKELEEEETLELTLHDRIAQSNFTHAIFRIYLPELATMRS